MIFVLVIMMGLYACHSGFLKSSDVVTRTVTKTITVVKIDKNIVIGSLPLYKHPVAKVLSLDEFIDTKRSENITIYLRTFLTGLKVTAV